MGPETPLDEVSGSCGGGQGCRGGHQSGQADGVFLGMIGPNDFHLDRHCRACRDGADAAGREAGHRAGGHLLVGRELADLGRTSMCCR